MEMTPMSLSVQTPPNLTQESGFADSRRTGDVASPVSDGLLEDLVDLAFAADRPFDPGFLHAHETARP
jgi:hypothetical protein